MVNTLDLDKIESGGQGSADTRNSGPQLVNHNLDEIFNDDPIMLPTHRRPGTSITSQYGNVQSNLMSPISSNLMQPSRERMTNRHLGQSQEAKEALDVVFAQLFNTQDTPACLKALTELDEVIKDEGKVWLLTDRMDQLLLLAGLSTAMSLTIN